MGNLLRCHENGDDNDPSENVGRRRRRPKEGGDTAANKSADVEAAKLESKAKPKFKLEPAPYRDPSGSSLYAEKTCIDDEVLVVRYLHLMDPAVVGGLVGHRERHEAGSGEAKRCRVSFRAESFDSQSSTTSERREFILDLVDNLPETFVDDALPPASARGRLESWSSCSEVFVDCSSGAPAELSIAAGQAVTSATAEIALMA